MAGGESLRGILRPRRAKCPLWLAEPSFRRHSRSASSCSVGRGHPVGLARGFIVTAGALRPICRPHAPCRCYALRPASGAVITVTTITISFLPMPFGVRTGRPQQPWLGLRTGAPLGGRL
jgi:hypothetical protein